MVAGLQLAGILQLLLQQTGLFHERGLEDFGHGKGWLISAALFPGLAERGSACDLGGLKGDVCALGGWRGQDKGAAAVQVDGLICYQLRDVCGRALLEGHALRLAGARGSWLL